ncbi:MAG: hypothetical protein P8H65_03920 [Rhodothermales bacterium]|nr:hypothetical protein [Rhodothermales bacterium]MDG2016745.1 hypothetical protein [Rhodothermales bacterium]
MDSNRLSSEGNNTPAFVRPFLHALNRMQADEVLRPTQYLERARILMVDRLGLAGSMPHASFARGIVGVMADHTHYFDGFALMLRMKQGISVALRVNQEQTTRIMLEGVSSILNMDDRDVNQRGLKGLLAHVIASVGLSEGRQYDISVVGGIPTGLGAAFHAAFTVALVKALHSAHDVESEKSLVRDQATEALVNWYGHRFSPAYVIGVMEEFSSPFLLVDTSTLESLPIEVTGKTRPGWGIVEWTRDWEPGFVASASRMKWTHTALKDLKGRGFPKLTSLRDLEHRDLEKAMDSLPRRSRNVVKHLVLENRNVQKLVVAIKKADWQFFGALMMISQASKNADWSTTDQIHSRVTQETESASMDGIFGAVQSGEGGCMVVLGQPFSIPSFLDNVREKVSGHTKEEIETFIV